jgi:hypothetical protein
MTPQTPGVFFFETLNPLFSGLVVNADDRQSKLKLARVCSMLFAGEVVI